MRKRAGDAPRVIEARERAAREFHRRAGVEHEVAAEVRVGLELLHVKAIRAREHAPVEKLEIIARRVCPILRKLDRRPARGAAMNPRDRPEHRQPHRDGEPREARDHAGVEEGPAHWISDFKFQISDVVTSQRGISEFGPI